MPARLPIALGSDFWAEYEIGESFRIVHLDRKASVMPV